MKNDVTDFCWTSASRTDVGRFRMYNEDSVLDLPERGLWVVADGMGGHSSGDYASNAIVSGLSGVQPPASLEAFADEVRQRLDDVNRHINETSAQNKATMGSTVVGLLANGGHGVVLWAGDSRAYRYRSGELSRLTRDHSQVEELVRLGLLAPDEAERHPAKNLITRAVGIAESLYLDSEILDLAVNDIFLLASDGLYQEVDEKTISECLSLGDCQSSCDALIESTLSQLARDNVSVVVVRIVDGEEGAH